MSAGVIESIPTDFTSGESNEGPAHRLGPRQHHGPEPRATTRWCHDRPIFTDKASGKDAQRSQLDALFSFVREGDTVVVHSMDRLARNLDDLWSIVQSLTGRGIRIEFVKEHISFTGEDAPMANLLLSVMGAFAEFERALIRERELEGITLAKARGVYKGRNPALTVTQVAKLRSRAAAGEQKIALVREYGISRDTVYQYLAAC